MYTIFCGYVWHMYGILSACYYWEVTVTCHYKNEGKVEHMDWKIDESVREKVLKFKEDYELLFQEMTGPMKKLAGEVIEYLQQKELWEDPEAILNVIGVLPGCYFRFTLYRQYYEIKDKADGSAADLNCKVRKVDREILRRVQDAAEDYEEKEGRLRQMQKEAEKLILGYLKETGLWDDLEAIQEMRCCLPICVLQHKLDERWYELWVGENGE